MNEEFKDVAPYVDRTERMLLRRWLAVEVGVTPKWEQVGARKSRVSRIWVKKAWIEKCLEVWTRKYTNPKSRFVSTRVETYQFFQRLLLLWDND